jgi:hypothetical protein
VAADLLERVAEGEGRVLGVGADEGIRRTSHHDGLADAVAVAVAGVGAGQVASGLMTARPG